MLTLRDVLNWDLLASHEVIAGAQGLDAEVRSVTVIDAPDAVNWVKVHELVVTTTFPVHDNPGALVHLVEQLAARKAAGLGVKLTRYLREVPANALARADELGLTVVSLPGSLAWSDLIGAIFSNVSDVGTAPQLSAIYRGFSQHRSRISTAAELLELVASFVSMPLLLAIEDETGLQIDSRGLSANEAEVFADTLLQENADPEGISRRIIAGVPIAFAGTGVGHGGAGVVAVLETHQIASETDQECLRLAVILIHGLLERAALTSTATSNTELFNDLLDPLMSAQARSLLMDRARPNTPDWQLVAARVFDPVGLDAGRLVMRLRQFARRHGALFLQSDVNAHLLAIPETDQTPRSVDTRLRELEQIWLRQAEGAPGLRYALGQAGPGALDRHALTLRHEAIEALTFGTRIGGFNRLYRHDDLLLLRLAGHPAVINDSGDSLRRFIAPLTDLGAAGEPLIDTLRIWLQEDESIPRTATRMGLHPNSVRHRLDRARKVLGVAEFGTSVRLRLHVVLQLLPILRENR